MRPNFNPRPANFTFLLTLAMVPIYLGAGYLFVATDLWLDEVPRPRRYYVGGVLFAWAAFRGLTIWLRYRQVKREQEEENEEL